MSRTQRPPSPEEEEEVIDLQDEEEDEEMDFGGFLANLLVSEEGESVGVTLAKIAQHMEMQNKLLVKLVTHLVKSSKAS
jgi:hypothetical protein